MLLQLWHEWRLLIGLLLALLAVAVKTRLSRTRENSASKSDIVLTEKHQEPLPITTHHSSATPTPQQLSAKRSKQTHASAKGPKRIKGQALRKHPLPTDRTPSVVQPLVFFASLGGSTEACANDFVAAFNRDLQIRADSKLREARLLNISDIELDDYFTAPPKSDVQYLYIVLLPSYNIDTNLDLLLEHLRETHHDFRIDTAPLSPILGYAVFGFGDRQAWPTEEEGFCSQAKTADKWLAKLTSKKRAYPLGMGDVNTDVVPRLNEWRQGVLNIALDLAAGASLGEGVPGSGDAVESDAEDEDDDDDDDELTGNNKAKPKTRASNVADLEALGDGVLDEPASRDGPVPVDFTTHRTKSKPTLTVTAPKEMVPKTSPTYAALTKQGYTIVGSHSGVKICRWTKSALRGRGSCYKFSFYGIQSHLCMESTPSLSCSNKCVFCWRHGTNPVGTTWRWQVDDPKTIFEGVKAGHYRKIKMMRGVPGVRAERFEEAMRIRHCALSLVGEPIFYPYINDFTAMLHAEHISSFLVCNAQHPDQLETLQPVTQLYVSIDASNKESLRKIDRPLHRDFWERFNRCLDILKEKRFRQRTVYRLTLVKGFNIDDEAEGYADLVERGLPCFVEVKGVTYCGTSTSAGAGLTMQNVPFYEEVCSFVEALNRALNKRGLGYGIAAEHAHSCCILLASNRFFKNGQWHTVIDYGRFFSCLESGKEFAPEDYIAPTEVWARWGNGGFDPADERVDRKGRKKLPSTT